MTSRRPKAESQEATSAEFKALAHPLRLRILRLCLHGGMTNKELADRLGLDPATSLYHVRTLLRTGFLEQEPVRTGARGALEKPYRATHKSWALAIPRSGDQLTTIVASIDALRAEVVAAGPDALVTSARLGLQLSDAEIIELKERIGAIVEDFAQRPPTPNGSRVGLFAVAHRFE